MRIQLRVGIRYSAVGRIGPFPLLLIPGRASALGDALQASRIRICAFRHRPTTGFVSLPPGLNRTPAPWAFGVAPAWRPPDQAFRRLWPAGLRAPGRRDRPFQRRFRPASLRPAGPPPRRRPSGRAPILHLFRRAFRHFNFSQPGRASWIQQFRRFFVCLALIASAHNLGFTARRPSPDGSSIPASSNQIGIHNRCPVNSIAPTIYLHSSSVRDQPGLGTGVASGLAQAIHTFGIVHLPQAHSARRPHRAAGVGRRRAAPASASTFRASAFRPGRLRQRLAGVTAAGLSAWHRHSGPGLAPPAFQPQHRLRPGAGRPPPGIRLGSSAFPDHRVAICSSLPQPIFRDPAQPARARAPFAAWLGPAAHHHLASPSARASRRHSGRASPGSPASARRPGLTIQPPSGASGQPPGIPGLGSSRAIPGARAFAGPFAAQQHFRFYPLPPPAPPGIALPSLTVNGL